MAAEKLRDKINKLLRTRDPVRRNELCLELLEEFRPALHEERRRAASDAIAGGMRQVDYARRIGVSRAVVSALLRAETTG